ncbi:tetratricopeptide repeat protein [Agromyces badenianii]|uniref:tetratricopeptide repeat protein n=1 Tax=Agromyces badenianii TaxID=2080742 RepID=UPI0011B258FF|nr:tetratricopeptide repeat protein [Agromyces badenianii]
MIETARSLALAGRVRDAGRLLRAHLAEDPANAELRQAIARIYRETNHPEQAGRYEFFLTRSSRAERAAYLDLSSRPTLMKHGSAS